MRQFASKSVNPILMSPAEVVGAREPRLGDTVETQEMRAFIAERLARVGRCAVAVGTEFLGSVLTYNTTDHAHLISFCAAAVATGTAVVGAHYYVDAAETAAHLLETGRAETFQEMNAVLLELPAAPQPPTPPDLG